MKTKVPLLLAVLALFAGRARPEPPPSSLSTGVPEELRRLEFLPPQEALDLYRETIRANDPLAAEAGAWLARNVGLATWLPVYFEDTPVFFENSGERDEVVRIVRALPAEWAVRCLIELSRDDRLAYSAREGDPEYHRELEDKRREDLRTWFTALAKAGQYQASEVEDLVRANSRMKIPPRGGDAEYRRKEREFQRLLADLAGEPRICTDDSQVEALFEVYGESGHPEGDNEKLATGALYSMRLHGVPPWRERSGLSVAGWLRLPAQARRIPEIVKETWGERAILNEDLGLGPDNRLLPARTRTKLSATGGQRPSLPESGAGPVGDVLAAPAARRSGVALYLACGLLTAGLAAVGWRRLKAG